jgi:hypothetical protein
VHFIQLRSILHPDTLKNGNGGMANTKSVILLILLLIITVTVGSPHLSFGFFRAEIDRLVAQPIHHPSINQCGDYTTFRYDKFPGIGMNQIN